MRRDLARYAGQRLRFGATLRRFGSRTDRTGQKQRTACLDTVRVGSRIVAGHVWIDWLDRSRAKPGDEIELTATVQSYQKRMATHRRRGRTRWKVVTDYQLTDVDRVTVV
jgi:hypothetical protein